MFSKIPYIVKCMADFWNPHTSLSDMKSASFEIAMHMTMPLRPDKSNLESAGFVAIEPTKLQYTNEWGHCLALLNSNIPGAMLKFGKNGQDRRDDETIIAETIGDVYFYVVTRMHREMNPAKSPEYSFRG